MCCTNGKNSLRRNSLRRCSACRSWGVRTTVGAAAPRVHCAATIGRGRCWARARAARNSAHPPCSAKTFCGNGIRLCRSAVARPYYPSHPCALFPPRAVPGKSALQPAAHTFGPPPQCPRARRPLFVPTTLIISSVATPIIIKHSSKLSCSVMCAIKCYCNA